MIVGDTDNLERVNTPRDLLVLVVVSDINDGMCIATLCPERHACMRCAWRVRCSPADRTGRSGQQAVTATPTDA
jgi:hypothetical protein